MAAAQERVEVVELAALAFVTHPRARIGVPASRAVKQIEHVRIGAIVALPIADVFVVRFQRVLAACIFFAAGCAMQQAAQGAKGDRFIVTAQRKSGWAPIVMPATIDSTYRR